MSDKENSQNSSVRKDDIKSASKLLNQLYSNNTDDNIKINVLLQSVDAGGFALLIFICSIIMVIPTPPPISTISSIIIIFFAIQMILGFKQVWLPKFITEKSIKRKTLAIIVEKSSMYLYKLERFTRRRITFMNSETAEKIIGLFIFILALISLIPIVFANTVPGLALILISFGLLNKDGLLIIIGFVIGFLSIFAVWTLVSFGKAVILKILDEIF